MKECEVKKWPKSGPNLKKVAQKWPKTDPRFWAGKVEKRSDLGTWQIRLQLEGRRVRFDTFTSNKTEASTRARDIYLFGRANGRIAAISRFKMDPSREDAEITTVGELIAAVEGLSPSKGTKSFSQYVGCFRQLSYEINASASTRRRFDRCRFDYRGEGRLLWLKFVDEIRLDTLTRDSVEKWRSKKKASTAATQIRQAKAMLGERVVGSDGDAVKAFWAKLPTPVPLSDVRAKTPRAKRHATVLAADGETLSAMATKELKESDPEVYKAFILCLFAGLRRAEADHLQWDAVDFRKGTIRVLENLYFRPKSDEGTRTIDVELDVLAELQAAEAKGPFVLQGRRRPLVQARQYRSYRRCAQTWKRLSQWLKAKGVNVLKPIHYLRKESGSFVASAFGIEAARRHLGHADIAVTSAHYSDKKKRVTVKI